MKFGNLVHFSLGATLAIAGQASRTRRKSLIVCGPQMYFGQVETQRGDEVAQQPDAYLSFSPTYIVPPEDSASDSSSSSSSSASQSCHSISSTTNISLTNSSNPTSVGYPYISSYLGQISRGSKGRNRIKKPSSLDLPFPARDVRILELPKPYPIEGSMTHDYEDPEITEWLKEPETATRRGQYSDWKFRRYWARGYLDFTFEPCKKDGEMIELVVDNTTTIDFGLSVSCVAAEKILGRDRNFCPKGFLLPIKTLVPAQRETRIEFYTTDSLVDITREGHFLHLLGKIVPGEELGKPKNEIITPGYVRKEKRKRRGTSARPSEREKGRSSMAAFPRSLIFRRPFIKLKRDESSPYTTLNPINPAGSRKITRKTWNSLKFVHRNKSGHGWSFLFKALDGMIKVTIRLREEVEPKDFIVHMAIVASEKMILSSTYQMKDTMMIYQAQTKFNTSNRSIALDLCTIEHFLQMMKNLGKDTSAAYFAVGIHPLNFDLEYAGILPVNIRSTILEYLLKEDGHISWGGLRRRSFSHIPRTNPVSASIQRSFSDTDLLRTKLLKPNTFLQKNIEKLSHENDEDGVSGSKNNDGS